MKTLLVMSVTGGLLALTVMAVRAACGKRLDPRVTAALWLPVALCLLVPLRVPSTVSVLNLPAAARVEQTVQAVQQQSENTLGAVAFVTTAPAAQPSAPARDNANPPSSGGDPAPEKALNTHSFRMPTLSQILTGVWLLGAAIAAAYIALVNAKFAGRVRRSQRPVELLPQEKRLLGKTQVFVSRAVPSPCLMNPLRPKIIVTPAVLNDPDRMRHVLAHELSHKKQGDLWWAVLRSIVLIVHWFNPVVWIAASVSRADSENACDVRAIALLGEDQRLEYGKTLLSFLRGKPRAGSLVNAATTMAQSKQQLRRRISLIAKKKKFTLVAAVLAIVLVLTGCAVTMTGPAQHDSAAPSASPAETPQSADADVPDSIRAQMRRIEENTNLTFQDMLPDALPDAEGVTFYGRQTAGAETIYLLGEAQDGASLPELTGGAQIAVNLSESLRLYVVQDADGALQTAVSLLADDRPDWVIAQMNALEAAVEPEVSGFTSLSSEEAQTLVPALEGDFTCFARRSAEGDTYLIAVGKPGLDVANAEGEMLWNVYYTSGAEDTTDEAILTQTVVTSEGVNDLRSYHLDGAQAAVWLDTDDAPNKNTFLILVSSDNPVMHYALNDRLSAYRYAKTMGMSIEQPRSTPYASVYYLTQESLEKTGLYDPYTYFFELDGEGRELADALDAAEVKLFADGISVDWEHNLDTFDYIYTDKATYSLGSRYIRVSKDYRVLGVIEDEALVERMRALFEQRVGFDPLLDIAQWASEGSFTSATLNDGVIRSNQANNQKDFQMEGQTVTDAESLAALQKLLSRATYLSGGAGCPFGDFLTVTRDDGQTLTISVATDSCGALCYNGNSYYSYGKQEKLKAIFPEWDLGWE